MNRNDIILKLEKIINDPTNRSKNILSFQKEILEGDDYKDTDHIMELLVNLAYDMDYFEPNPEIRKEDPSYYDINKLKNEILKILNILKHSPT